MTFRLVPNRITKWFDDRGDLHYGYYPNSRYISLSTKDKITLVHYMNHLRIHDQELFRHIQIIYSKEPNVFLNKIQKDSFSRYYIIFKEMEDVKL